MIKVSIIIPVYNANSTIKKALQSIKAQELSVFEVIIINDGSTDGSEDEITDFITNNNDLNITYFKQCNRGVASARNEGIRRAKGSYIAFLDADDYWLPGKLHTQIDILDNHKDIFLCGTMFEGFTLNIDKLKPILLPDLYEVTFKQQLFKNHFQPSTVLFRKSILNKCGLFIEGMTHAEEGLFFYKIVHYYKCALLNKNFIIYGDGKSLFGHSGLSSNLWKMEKGELFNYRYLFKNKIITNSQYFFLSAISIMKFLRRILITIIKK